MTFFNQKKKRFQNILNVLFEAQDKKKLSNLVILMLVGMILELFGVGLIFPALKMLTDNDFLSKIYGFLNINELDSEILLLLIVSVFIIFFGLKNLYLWMVLKRYSSFIAQYEANLQFRLFKGYLNKSVAYFKEKIPQIL